MSLIKVSILNGFSVATKIGCNLLVNKLLAVYIGPSGYAVLGQFQNIVSILLNLGGGVMGVPISKITSQYFDDSEKQIIYWQTAVRLTVFCSSIIALLVLVMGNNLSKYLLFQDSYKGLVYILGLAIPGMALNNLLMAIINGKKEFNTYIAFNIITSITSTAVVALLTYLYGLNGALIAILLMPTLMLLIIIKISNKFHWLNLKNIWGKINLEAAKKLSVLAMMGITSSIAAPLTLSTIRDSMVLTLGIQSAGYWQATWKLSETYLMIVTTTLSVYYLPRIAEIRKGLELKKEILKVSGVMLPLTAVISLMIFIFKEDVVKIIFTEEFMPMIKLFKWQLVGDIIKIASWILSFVMLGRGLVREFIATEIIFSGTFIYLSEVLVESYGLIGVSISYCVNNSLYLIALYFMINKEIKKIKN